MSVARGVGLIAASVFVAILLMEVGLRIMGYSRPVFYRYDEVLGANLRPGVAGYYKKEDLIYIRLNDDGMRGPDRPYVKPASTVRVAVMGDSFTEGFQVGYEDLFTTVLERALAKCPAGDAGIEVLNFGVSGFGTAREILKYQEHARRYDPDLVLLMFYPGNDYRNNHPGLESNPLLPYFVMNGDKPVLDASFRSSGVFKKKLRYSNARNTIVNWSRALQLVNEVLVAWKTGSLFARAADPEVRPEPVPIPYIEPVEPIWKEAQRATDAMLVLLAEHVKSEGRKFVLANVVAAEASPDHQTRKAWADAQRGRGFAGEEERFRRLAQSSGFEFVGLIEPVLRHIDRTGDDLFYFDYLGRSGGHWNKIGHRVVGMALADRICPFLHADAASS